MMKAFDLNDLPPLDTPDESSSFEEAEGEASEDALPEADEADEAEESFGEDLDTDEEKEDVAPDLGPVESVSSAETVPAVAPLPERRDVDFRTLNRIFDGRLACRHLSDLDLLDLRDWHKDLKAMLFQKGDRYTLAIQSIQIDIDKLERMIDFRRVRLQPVSAPQTVGTPSPSITAIAPDSYGGTISHSSREDSTSLSPRNEGKLIVLDQIWGWKTMNVDKMVDSVKGAEKVEKPGNDGSIDQRLSSAYNGGASPYGYRGTFG